MSNPFVPSPTPATTLRIGQLSELTGRSIHALRWYEAQGLIPGVVRDAGGRRQFNDQHVAWIALMDRLRCTGMSIAEMRHYTRLVKQGKTTLRERQALLQAHRERVQTRVADRTAALSFLDSKIDFYGQWLHSGKRPPLPVFETPKARRTQS
jgi:DNA-binding transcriptional MerR regulator